MDDLLKILEHARRIKKLKRTGWVQHNIKNPESVADHSYRVSLMAMLLADKLNLNQEKMMKMALIHDLAESIVGDLVSEKGINTVSSKEAKFEQENTAMKEIFSEDFKEYYNLWMEYEKQESEEAKCLKQIDKIEATLQAKEYEEDQNIELKEWAYNAEKYIDNSELKKLFDKVKNIK